MIFQNIEFSLRAKKFKLNYSVGIINLGLGNISSVVNILKKLGIKSFIINEVNQVGNFNFLIIPGVGSFDYAMKEIDNKGWREGIISHVERGRYLLGICLGMQILCNKSEEGDLGGLGLIPGEFKKFVFENKKIKVPHMGWNTVDFTPQISTFFKNDFALDSNRYYFVHSFRYFHNNIDNVYGFTNYGIKFASIIGKDNVMGCQFHPEKSHMNGLHFLRKYFEFINK